MPKFWLYIDLKRRALPHSLWTCNKEMPVPFLEFPFSLLLHWLDKFRSRHGINANQWLRQSY